MPINYQAHKSRRSLNFSGDYMPFKSGAQGRMSIFDSPSRVR